MMTKQTVISSDAWGSRLRRRVLQWTLLGAVSALLLWSANGMAQVVPPDADEVVPAGAVAPVATTPAADANGLDAAKVDAFLDGLVPYLIADGDLAGAVVTVVERGRVVTARGFGHADVASRAPVDPEHTLFRPGSVSKLFVWTSVMQLVEQGKLDLDTDINTYLDFKVPVTGEPITLRHVMTHTSGLEERMRYLILLGPDAPGTPDNYLKDWVPEQIFAPGTRPAYSNYATGVAGRIVERVSGLSFEEYVERNIFAPLGMQYASFRQQLPAELLSHVASGYRLASGNPSPAENTLASGVGGLYASGTAMSRFMRAILNGGELDGQRILGAEATAQMLTAQPAVLPPLAPMALGWMTSDVGGYPVVSHGGTTMFFYSWLYLLPEQGIGVFVSTNSAGRDAAGSALRAQVFERFVDTFLPARPIDKAGAGVDAATAAAHAKALAGIGWQSTRRPQSSHFKLMALLSPTRVHAHDDGTISVDGLKELNGQLRRWREVSPWVWQQVDGRNLLAVQVVDDRPVYFAADPMGSVMGYDPIPASRSPLWLRPLLLVALVVLGLTAALRVGGVFVRRRYKSASPAKGRLRTLQTLAITGLFVALVGVLLYIRAVSVPGAVASPSMAMLWVLRIVSWLALAASLVLAWVAVRQPATCARSSRVWSWVLALAGLVLAWTILVHGLAFASAQY